MANQMINNSIRSEFELLTHANYIEGRINSNDMFKSIFWHIRAPMAKCKEKVESIKLSLENGFRLKDKPMLISCTIAIS